MDKRIFLWIIIAILVLAVVYVTFFKNSGTGAVIGADGRLDTTGWTENEKMNYEMHDTIPARIQQTSSSTSASSGMVGGC